MRKKDHTSTSLSPPPPRGLHVGQHMAPPDHHLAWPNCWSGSPCQSIMPLLLYMQIRHKHLCLMRHIGHGLEFLDHLLHLKDRPKGTVSSGTWSCEKHGKDEIREGRGGTRSKFRTSRYRVTRYNRTMRHRQQHKFPRRTRCAVAMRACANIAQYQLGASWRDHGLGGL